MATRRSPTEVREPSSRRSSSPFAPAERASSPLAPQPAYTDPRIPIVEAEAARHRCEAARLREENRVVRAAYLREEGAVSFMIPTTGNIYTKAAVLEHMTLR